MSSNSVNSIVDSNILLGVFNKHDDNNPISEKLISMSKNMFILEDVLKESSNSINMKWGNIIFEILNFYADIDFSLENDIIAQQEDKLLEKLNSEFGPQIAYNKYFIEKSREIRHQCNDYKGMREKLMKLQISIRDIDKFKESLFLKIKRINPDHRTRIFGYTNKEKHFRINYNLIKNCTESIEFPGNNGNYDKKIFQKVMACYPDKYDLPAYFLTEDHAFFKKCIESLDKLAKETDSKFDNLETVLLSEFLKEYSQSN
ncbi:hypothetical protein MMKA1_04840 [Methanococcus maripaludis KA1]|uniref:PIN domain-containing protein n=1 Tax=Methanococcus maripaludis KA1 TaxID=637914 RepID=A0A2Z5PT35_METMI|nr:hypothetical protein [Methanococcus maripaludis]BAP60601.1 hypothetical protein MMKA1_04840 [Methanococcus maripaludis KA1]